MEKPWPAFNFQLKNKKIVFNVQMGFYHCNQFQRNGLTTKRKKKSPLFSSEVHWSHTKIQANFPSKNYLPIPSATAVREKSEMDTQRNAY